MTHYLIQNKISKPNLVHLFQASQATLAVRGNPKYLGRLHRED
jgi:hypothetical protein